MLDSYEFRDHPFASARGLRRRGVSGPPCRAARLALQQEAAAEIARERVSSGNGKEGWSVRSRMFAGGSVGKMLSPSPGETALGCQFMAGRDPATNPGRAWR